MARSRATDNIAQHPASQHQGGTPVPTDVDPDAAIDNPEVREVILGSFKEKQEHEEARKAINAKIRAIDEGLESRGLNKHALKHLYRHFKMNEKDKAGYDRTIVVGRRAVGDPIQPSLFEESPDSNVSH